MRRTIPIPALAPEDLAPEDPIFASKFALDIGPWVAMYESTDWAETKPSNWEENKMLANTLAKSNIAICRTLKVENGYPDDDGLNDEGIWSL